MDTPTAPRTEDIDYLNIDGVTLSATLYRPAGSNYPGVIDVHGGKWVTNTRFNNEMIATRLAQRGIAVLSIDFRMPPDAGYPGSIHDIHYAVRWFKQNAAAFGIRPGALGGFATSSGGHQMLLTSLLPHAEPYGVHPLSDDAGTGTDASLPFLITGWPVSDPTTRYAYAETNGLDELLDAHKLYWNPLSLMEDGNPQRILEQGRFEALPDLLLLQGSADENFDYRMNEKFAATYREVGGNAEFVLYDGASHAFMNREPDSAAAQDALERIAAFIHAQTA